MLSLSVNNLSKSFHQTLFEDFTLSLEGSQIIGLIGDNGSGKSTLLRILAGEETGTTGSVHWSDDVNLGYLPQEILEGEALSGGQKKIAKLRNLFFAQKKNVILLDEPDNHLDIENKLWLEEILKNFEGIVIMISHDRALLSNVTNRVWNVSEEKVTDYRFGYKKFGDFHQQELEERFHLFKTQEKERQRLEKLVDLFRVRAAANSKLVGQFHNMEKRLARMENEMVTAPPVEKNSLGIEVSLGKQHQRKTAVFAQNISKTFDQKKILERLKFHLFCGEKIAIVGPNGKGKTTLMKILAQKLEPDRGSVEYGPGLKVGYYSQEHLENLDEKKKPVEELDEIRPGTIYDHEKYLERFLFTKQISNTQIKYLSGGQRSRVQLAKFLIVDPEVLLLDEPTNHLDIKSVEVLEKFLLEYKGALVLISHDRSLIGNVVQKIYTIENGQLLEQI